MFLICRCSISVVETRLSVMNTMIVGGNRKHVCTNLAQHMQVSNKRNTLIFNVNDT